MACKSAAALLTAAAAVSQAEALSTNAQQRDVCKCLKWTEAYEHGYVACGTTNEYHFALSSNVSFIPPMLLSEPEDEVQKQQIKDALENQFPELNKIVKDFKVSFCSEFFHRLTDNVCVNKNIGHDEGQWCYVSNSCQDLGGGFPIPNSLLSWKTCGSRDTQLRDFMPEKLATFAKEKGVSLAVLHKMSYPVFEKRVWKELEAAWVPGKTFGPLTADEHKLLDDIIKSGKPYSFDTRRQFHQGLPHRIAVGHKVYEVYDPTGNHMETDDVDLSFPYDVRCVMNCDQ